MEGQPAEEYTLEQAKDWYDYQALQVEQKFKDLNSDALEDIKNKIRRKQTVQEKNQNREILERQQKKLVEQMKLHVKECEHPTCEAVNEIVLLYNLSNLHDIKKDPVFLITREGECTGHVRTKCPVGSKSNERMIQIHNLLKNSAQTYLK